MSALTRREALAAALYYAGPLLPGGHAVPTVEWQQQPPAAQRQWLEAADYLLTALEKVGAL